MSPSLRDRVPIASPLLHPCLRHRAIASAIATAAALSSLALLAACGTNAANRPSAGASASSSTTASAPPTPTLDHQIAVATFDAVWVKVRDTHFDPNMNGVDWIAVRETYRPQAEAATTPQQLRDAISGMLGELGQSHFGLIPGEAYAVAVEVEEEPATPASRDSDSTAGRTNATSSGSASEARGDRDSNPRRSDDAPASIAPPGWTGLVARFVGDEPMVVRVERDSPALRAGVQPGDVIASIDGRDPARLRKIADADPESAMLHYEMNAVLGGSLVPEEGASVSIVLRSPGGSSRTVELVGEAMQGELARMGNLPPMEARLEHRILDANELSALGLEPCGGDTISEIAFAVWLPQIAAPFDEAIDASRETLGVVIDLRGNPGGVGGMAMGIGGHFTAEPISLGTMKTRDTEVHFRSNPRRVDRAGNPVEPLDVPVAILVDEMSASTSEIFAGGMQEAGLARVFGRRTPGAALPAAMLELPNGDVLLHAFADFTTPSGVRLEGRGVIPDETIELSAEVLSQGADPDLRAAAAWILDQWLTPEDETGRADASVSAASLPEGS